MLELFHPLLQTWFLETLGAPTAAQSQAWPSIAQGKNTLLLAPTGSGKTLAAFLVAINRIMFGKEPATISGVRVLYISPLKALGVDIERNLQMPLAGLRAAAERAGTPHRVPSVGIRSGDTPASERARIGKRPPDILITTPESLYLLLTSKARDVLRSVETVIVDEIHSLVPTKRGSHLFVSLERLEALRRNYRKDVPSLQRVGLSATQRPLDEVARLLGGAEVAGSPDPIPIPRPVEIVEAGRRKQLALRIEVPVEDLAKLAETSRPEKPSGRGPLPSIWPAIHQRLVELIREHRSTMLFVNNRRLAERIASAVNDLAGEELALAHHGSMAKATRQTVEGQLKRGELRAIVATSSLELGIDMGAVDLVIQIESPPSIASGLQRVGRAGHQVGAPSTGVIFPKYRGDLLACSAAAERMQDGEVEETFYPRNALDVVAQQIVAMTATGPISVDAAFATMRSAAPFADLPRTSFEGVLDMLSGRYPSDEFSELRPRITWDRTTGTLLPRASTRRLAVLNAGTIPDRGMYGVFLVGTDGQPGSRVGELDEEMVFETRAGDVFLLGASSWRVVEITHDRVLVIPAPGEPGKMPFWRGDGPGRPLEFGEAIGALARRLASLDRDAAAKLLSSRHGLDERAAANLVNYLQAQIEATGDVPSDQTIVIECFIDEVGDWRVLILTPFGSRVHAPWATAVAGRLRESAHGEVDVMWTDDGIVFRLPESDQPAALSELVPAADAIDDLVMHELSSTALFAARFRENAARALLLPRRAPGQRVPLWLQRRKSADLLKVASRYPDFPILLETFRECLRDIFDLPGLKRVLRRIEERSLRVRQVLTKSPSPFASAVLFTFSSNFIYDGDTPLSERRAQALALDQTQLRELLGEIELRELLDGEVIAQVERELQRLDARFPVTNPDQVHDLLRYVGDLTEAELGERCGEPVPQPDAIRSFLLALQAQGRVVPATIAGEQRWIAGEDASRYRDALGTVLPTGLPDVFVAAVADPLGDLISRFARTHGPFQTSDVAARFALDARVVEQTLRRLEVQGRVIEGEFRPGGGGQEWCESDVLKLIKRRSLARLRQQVEPVEPVVLASFMLDWQGLMRPHRGLDGLLDVIEQLQGLALPASVIERDVLTARVVSYRPHDLDELCLAGEVVWRGCGSLGSGDGRIALYLADQWPLLAAPAEQVDHELGNRIIAALAASGAQFFETLHGQLGGFRNDVLNALWELVWAGVVTNDTLRPLRSWLRGLKSERPERHRRQRAFRSRRSVLLPGSEGRWSLLTMPPYAPSITERQMALATQLIERYGILTREMVVTEGTPGGFSGLYPVLKVMEESGKLRRGYFVAGQGAAQFAAPGADERLRRRRQAADVDEPETVILAAVDPANLYGAALPWPDVVDEAQRPQRTAGARVILHRGELLAFLGRTGESLTTFLPADDAERTTAVQSLVMALADLATPGHPLHLQHMDGQPAAISPLSPAFQAAGFVPHGGGLLRRPM